MEILHTQIYRLSHLPKTPLKTHTQPKRTQQQQQPSMANTSSERLWHTFRTLSAAAARAPDGSLLDGVLVARNKVFAQEEEERSWT